MTLLSDMAAGRLPRHPRDPEPRQTARSIIEARLGRKLGPVSEMPKDIRKALLGLGLHMEKLRRQIR